MKKLLFKNWLMLMALVMTCGFTACDDDDDNTGIAPIFPEKQTINLAAGGSQELTFEANTNWSLSSSAIWCVFVQNETENFVVSGTAGKQKVTVKVTDDALNSEKSVAKLELSMAGQKVVIGEVRRSGMEGKLELFDENGMHITELEVGYNEFKKFKVKANYRFAVTNMPSWVELDGGSLVGGINQEATGGLRVIEDGNVEKYPVTAEKNITITFSSEDGLYETHVPVVFKGMPAEEIDFEAPARDQWGWTISEDGQTFSNGVSISGSGGISYKKYVPFTIKAKEDDFEIVIIDEFVLNGELNREVMQSWGWLQFDIQNKCQVNFSAEELYPKDKRTAYVLAFPRTKYEEIKEDILGNIFDETGEIHSEYDNNNLLMVATQDVDKQDENAGLAVTAMDMETYETVKIPVTKVSDSQYEADEVYTMPYGTYPTYTVNPQMGLLWEEYNVEINTTYNVQMGENWQDKNVVEFTMPFDQQTGASIEIESDIVITMTSNDGSMTKILIITPNN